MSDGTENAASTPPSPRAARKGLGALTWGIVAIVTTFFGSAVGLGGLFAWIFSIVAISMAISGLRRMKAGAPYSKAQLIAGLVLGGISFVVGTLLFVTIVV